jgi:hypothetical protein
MAELAAGFATLSAFFGWRLFVVSRRFWVVDTMLKGILEGEVVIRKTEDGIELEMRRNTNG